MNKGYFIAEKLENGKPGKPLGNEDGAIMMFDELDLALPVIGALKADNPRLSLFQTEVTITGEVIL
jgi:hypothetical protein